ncbi:amidohydrolase family protein [Streptomyces sp. KL116D]|uniref:amidohydrolase family protein n=1 Tax=Streptomyces sp. KL116D TaxID=3045152 RepID=UPI003558B0BC
MCREHAGVGAVAYLERAGFLWERLLAVHCVELDAAGRATLAGHGVGVSYNPLSNMRLGSGIAPVPDMLDAGLRVGLVDGAASNAHPGRAGGAAHRRATCSGRHAARPICSASPRCSRWRRTARTGALGLEERPDGVRAGMQAGSGAAPLRPGLRVPPRT